MARQDGTGGYRPTHSKGERVVSGYPDFNNVSGRAATGRPESKATAGKAVPEASRYMRSASGKPAGKAAGKGGKAGFTPATALADGAAGHGGGTNGPARTGGGRKKRRGLKIALIVVAVLVVFAGIGAWQLWSSANIVKAQASSLQQTLEQFPDDILAGNNQAVEQEVRQIADSAAIMHQSTSGIFWTIGSYLPVVGTDITNARVLSSVFDELAQSVLLPLSSQLTTFSLDNLIGDGVINVQACTDLLGMLGEYAPAVDSAASQLAALKPGSIDQVNKVLEKVQPLFSQFNGLAAQADRLKAVVPDLLGANGSPAVYLVVAMNNVEIRTVGGFPGSWGTLTIDNGAISLSDFESYTTTQAGTAWQAIPAQDGEGNVLGANEFPNPQFATMVPNFTRAGEVLASFWQQVSSDQIRGVVGIDPIFVQYLLDLTGPVTTSAGATIDGSNAAKTLMHDTYLTVDQSLQDGYFSEVANLAFSHFLGSMGDISPADLVDTFKRAAQAYHLQLWFPNGDEQALARDYGLDGIMVSQDAEAPELGIFFNDGTWSKIDYYLNPTVDCQKTSDNADGSQTYQVTLTIENMINTPQGDMIDSLVEYIYGQNPAKNSDDDMLTTVLLSAPKDGTLADVSTDAQLEADTVSYTLYGNQTWAVRTHAAGGQTITITFTVTTAPQAASDMTICMTPTAKEIAGWN